MLESNELCLYIAFSSSNLYLADQKLIDKLLEVVDADKRTTNGDTYLHKLTRVRMPASPDSMISWYETLLRRGADPNGLNNAGESPLILLLNRKWHQIITVRLMKSLLDHCANEMQRTDAGDLPLHLASKNCEGDTRETLIKLLVDSFNRRTSIEVHQSETTKTRSWWIAYHSLRTTKRWSTSTCYAAFKKVDSEGIEKPLAKRLMVLAAEDILQNVKTKLQDMMVAPMFFEHDIITEKKHYVIILRDCKKLGLEVASTWYHFLLDLFD